MRQAVILAGGRGTRLAQRLGDLPKPLVGVDGVPLLLRQLRHLQASGITEVVLLVNHRAEKIEEFLKTVNLSLAVRVVNDGEPRGTAGAVLTILDDLDDRFLVVYGDTLFNLDLNRFERFHERNPGTAASLFLHPNDHPEDSDLVEVDEGQVVAFHPYPHPEGAWYPNLVNAALYIVEREALAPYRGLTPPLDFAKDLFARMLADGHRLAGYISSEYIKDLGTPARLDKAEAALQAGVVERATYRYPQRAVFLDRDGTLNEERGHIRRVEDLRVYPTVGPALKKLNDAEFRTVLVTNQPVIARGEATFGDLRRIHGRLDAEVARSKAFFDAQYVCPHHPDSGFPGEVRELKVKCSCRKPEPGLVLTAIADMNIDPSQSWFVGTAPPTSPPPGAAGVQAIGVRTGSAGQDGKYDAAPIVFVDDFAAAVDWILARTPLKEHP